MVFKRLTNVSSGGYLKTFISLFVCINGTFVINPKVVYNSLWDEEIEDKIGYIHVYIRVHSMCILISVSIVGLLNAKSEWQLNMDLFMTNKIEN